MGRNDICGRRDGHLGSGRGWEDLDDGVSDVGKEGKPGTRLWGFGLGDAG